MKRMTLIVALVCAMCTALAQTKDTALNRRISEFISVSKALNVPRIMDYVYPRIYELVPRKKLEQEMAKTFDSEEMTIIMDSIDVINTEPIFTAGTTSFTRFTTLTVIQLKMIEKDSLAEDNHMMYLEYFKSQFGKENVAYSGETGFFRIKTAKYALAIKDRYSKNRWTFVNQEQHKLLKKLLPLAVVKKYKI